MPTVAQGVHPESEALWRRLEAEVGRGSATMCLSRGRAAMAWGENRRGGIIGRWPGT